MVAGALYAFGAWIQLGRSLSASSNAAADVNLETITAVVIGGTSLFGGRGKISDAVVGGLVVAVILNGLPLVTQEAGIQFVVTGLVLLIAAGVDALSRRKSLAT